MLFCLGNEEDINPQNTNFKPVRQLSNKLQ